MYSHLCNLGRDIVTTIDGQDLNSGDLYIRASVNTDECWRHSIRYRVKVIDRQSVIPVMVHIDIVELKKDAVTNPTDS